MYSLPFSFKSFSQIQGTRLRRLVVMGFLAFLVSIVSSSGWGAFWDEEDSLGDDRSERRRYVNEGRSSGSSRRERAERALALAAEEAERERRYEEKMARAQRQHEQEMKAAAREKQLRQQKLEQQRFAHEERLEREKTAREREKRAEAARQREKEKREQARLEAERQELKELELEKLRIEKKIDARRGKASASYKDDFDPDDDDDDDNYSTEEDDDEEDNYVEKRAVRRSPTKDKLPLAKASVKKKAGALQDCLEQLELPGFFETVRPQAFDWWLDDKESSAEAVGRHAVAIVKGLATKEWDAGEPADRRVNGSILYYWEKRYEALLNSTETNPKAREIISALRSAYGSLSDRGTRNLTLFSKEKKGGKCEFKGLESLESHFLYKPAYDKSTFGTKVKSTYNADLTIYMKPITDPTEVVPRVLAMVSCVTNSHIKTRNIEGVDLLIPLSNPEELWDILHATNLVVRGLTHIIDPIHKVYILLSELKRSSEDVGKFLRIFNSKCLNGKGSVGSDFGQLQSLSLRLPLKKSDYTYLPTETLMSFMETEE